jgi:hypothetical protein
LAGAVLVMTLSWSPGRKSERVRRVDAYSDRDTGCPGIARFGRTSQVWCTDRATASDATGKDPDVGTAVHRQAQRADPHLAGRLRRRGGGAAMRPRRNVKLRPGVGPLTVSTLSLLFAPDPAIGESRRLTTATVAELIREQTWTTPPVDDLQPSRLEADLPH